MRKWIHNKILKWVLPSVAAFLRSFTDSDEKTRERKKAFHLDMTYKAYSKRKAELMAQAEKLKGAETA